MRHLSPVFRWRAGAYYRNGKRRFRNQRAAVIEHRRRVIDFFKQSRVFRRFQRGGGNIQLQQAFEAAVQEPLVRARAEFFRKRALQATFRRKVVPAGRLICGACIPIKRRKDTAITLRAGPKRKAEPKQISFPFAVLPLHLRVSPQYLLSRLLYCTASATWWARIASLPSRSAIVRDTLRMRV